MPLARPTTVWLVDSFNDGYWPTAEICNGNPQYCHSLMWNNHAKQSILRRMEIFITLRIHPAGVNLVLALFFEHITECRMVKSRCCWYV